MVGGINPLAFLVPLGIAILGVMLLPALLLPWKGFVVYACAGIATAVFSWYASNARSADIIVLSVPGALAIAIAIPVHIALRRGTASLRPRPLYVAFTLVAVPSLAIVGIELGKITWERYRLPEGFRDLPALYVPRVVAPRCEISVWRLTHGEQSPARFGPEWAKTPFIAKSVVPTEDRWLNGIGCSNVGPTLKDSIVDAMGLPGGMYLPGPTQGFMFLPSINVLVRSHDE